MSIYIICRAYFSISKEFKTILTKLTTIAPPKAAQNPRITNPSKSDEVNPRIIAFITNVNNPKVNIFSGSVNTIKMGLMDMLSNPNITEAISKSLSSLKIIPEKIKLAAPNDNELITNLRTKFLNTTSSHNI